MTDPDEYAQAERDIVMFHERELVQKPEWLRIMELIDEEINKRIALLVADDEGAEANRGAIHALREVKEMPERAYAKAVELIGDNE